VATWPTTRATADTGSADDAEREVSLYEAVGGMPFFTALVDAFYEGIVTDAVLLPLYPAEDLDGARHRLTLFLAQYWGGPTTYMEERGHPKLRMRHMPFHVGPAERDHWLLHMAAAVERTTEPGTDPRHADGLLRAGRRAPAQRHRAAHQQ
jgi:hemoglobin